MSRSLFITTASTLVLGLLVACSSSSSNGSSSSGGASSSSSSSSGGSSIKSCPGQGSTCTEAESADYTNCLISKCDASFQKCYGSNYKSGSFGGACGTYIGCTQACACNDNACLQKCGQPDQACLSCLQSDVLTCTQNAGCTLPACASSSSSSSSSSTSSSSSSGGTGATCADLQACCDKITNASIKDSCQQSHDAANGADSTCNTYYNAFKSQCP